MENKKMDESAASPTLFRSEVVEASALRYGVPIQAPGIGMWLTTTFVLAMLALAAIFLASSSLPRKETVSGSLVPSLGLLRISSQRSGIVSKVHVEEGAFVRQGDPVISVSVDSVIDGGQSIGRELSGVANQQTQASADRERAAEASLDSQDAGTRERMLGTKRQLDVLRSNQDLYLQQLRIAEQTLRDLGRLRADQLVSELQFRDAEVRVLNVRQSLSEIEARIAQLEQEYAQLGHELGRLKAERDANRARARSESLEAREKAITYRLGTEFHLVAQSVGLITSLEAKPGSTVMAGQALAVMMPEGSQLLAELWVPSSAIAFVDKGTEVRLMYDAFPYQKFGVGHAKVIKIARSPIRCGTQVFRRRKRYRDLPADSIDVLAARQVPANDVPIRCGAEGPGSGGPSFRAGPGVSSEHIGLGRLVPAACSG